MLCYKRILGCAFIIFCLFFLPLMWVEAQGAEELTLKEVLREALNQNRQIVMARKKLLEAEAMVQQAEGGRGWRGDLMLEGDRSKTPSYLQDLYSLGEQELGDSYSSYSGTVAISNVLWDTAESRASLELARLMMDKEKKNLEAMSYEVVIEVLENAFDVLQARMGLEVARESREVRQMELERMQKKKELEEAVPAQVQEAEVELETATVTVEMARDMLALAEERLMMETGLAAETVEALRLSCVQDIALPEEYNPWPWSKEQMQRMAAEHSSETHMSFLGVEMARLEKERVQKESRVDFSLHGSYLSPEHNIRAGVELTDEYRMIGTLSYFDTTLPDFEGINISEEDWEEFLEAWPWDTPPSWFPQRETMEDLLAAEIEPEDEWEIRVEARINLFDSGLRQARIEEKVASFQSAELMHEEALEGMEQMVHALYRELKQAHSAVQKEQLALALARQRLDDVKTMEEVGMATPLEENLAALGVLRSEMDLLEQIHTYELAKAELGAALGLEMDWFLDALNLP